MAESKWRTNPNMRLFLLELEGIVDKLKHELPCCVNCIHFTKSEECTYQGQRTRPPAEVIAFGCWAFEHDIPF